MRCGPLPRAMVVGIAISLASASGAAALPTGFEAIQSVTGLTFPTAVDWAPDGRMFIAEKAGRVLVVLPDGTRAAHPLLDISDHVNTYNDRGLLGLTVGEDFSANHHLYLLYVYEPNPLTPSDPGAKTSRLTRVTVRLDNTVESPAAPETVILGKVGTAPCPDSSNTSDCIPADAPSHSIGTVRADPDGTLWIGSGDATPGFERRFRSYDESSFAGKVVHIDRSGRGLPNHPFCPHDTDLNHVCTKLYAKGFRNPFRFSLRPGKGPVLGDVGASGREEIDLLQAGKNYGWPCYEGTIRSAAYQDTPECAAEYAKGGTADASAPPVYDYPTGTGATVIGGPVYPGGSYPDEYDGDIIFGDWAQNYMKRLKLGPGDTFGSVVGFDTNWAGVDIELGPNEIGR